MYRIRSTQIKAARALLGWSQNDLAEATGLSIATIRNLELGFISPRSTTMNVIREVVENAGLEFIDPEGIRRCLDEVKIFYGSDIHAAMKRIVEAGGEVLGQPITISGIGEYVSFLDTEGNRNSILQPMDRV